MMGHTNYVCVLYVYLAGSGNPTLLRRASSSSTASPSQSRAARSDRSRLATATTTAITNNEPVDQFFRWYNHTYQSERVLWGSATILKIRERRSSPVKWISQTELTQPTETWIGLRLDRKQGFFAFFVWCVYRPQWISAALYNSQVIVTVCGAVADWIMWTLTL